MTKPVTLTGPYLQTWETFEETKIPQNWSLAKQVTIYEDPEDSTVSWIDIFDGQTPLYSYVKVDGLEERDVSVLILTLMDHDEHPTGMVVFTKVNMEMYRQFMKDNLILPKEPQGDAELTKLLLEAHPYR